MIFFFFSWDTVMFSFSFPKNEILHCPKIALFFSERIIVLLMKAYPSQKGTLCLPAHVEYDPKNIEFGTSVLCLLPYFYFFLKPYGQLISYTRMYLSIIMDNEAKKFFFHSHQYSQDWLSHISLLIYKTSWKAQKLEYITHNSCF